MDEWKNEQMNVQMDKSNVQTNRWKKEKRVSERKTEWEKEKEIGWEKGCMSRIWWNV